MSKTNEIKKKRELQTRFQLFHNDNTARVLSWLGNDNPNESKELTGSKNAFFQLPVIQLGSGLNFDNTETQDNREDIHTIGEFINSNKKVSTLLKKKKSGIREQNNHVYKVHTNDNKAMIALKHKMRTSKRKMLRHELKTNSQPQKSVVTISKTNNYDQDLDNSDDDEHRPIKHSKKTFNLLFNKKNGKSK